MPSGPKAFISTILFLTSIFFVGCNGATGSSSGSNPGSGAQRPVALSAILLMGSINYLSSSNPILGWGCSIR